MNQLNLNVINRLCMTHKINPLHDIRRIECVKNESQKREVNIKIRLILPVNRDTPSCKHRVYMYIE